MRNISLLALMLIAISCGSSKKTVEQQYPNYGGYQPYHPQQQYVQNQQQQGILDPTTMQSNITQCERLANQGWQLGKQRAISVSVQPQQSM